MSFGEREFHGCGTFGLDEPRAVGVFHVAVLLGVFRTEGKGAFAVGEMGVAGPEVELEGVGDGASFVVDIVVGVPAVVVVGLVVPRVGTFGIDDVV